MSKEKISAGSTPNTPLKKAPNVVLNKVVGSKLVGTFEGRYENKNFPGKFDSLFSVEETNGSTTLWNKETQVDDEVEIEQGDRVFLKESTVLATALSKLNKGDRVEIVYTGKSVPKKKGFKPAYLYDIFKLEA